IDIEARPMWQPSLVEERITPPGPARSGATIFEVGKFSGYTSEKTMTVSEFEQDRLLALETLADAQAPFRESYRIEPISDAACRLTCHVEIGGLPKISEFFVRQATTRDLPQNFARLKSFLAHRTAKQSER